MIEVLSPSNTVAEMNDKQKFYYTHGVDEFYILDPMRTELLVWLRKEEVAMLYPQKEESWTSKRLGIEISVKSGQLEVFYPDGSPILTYAETRQQVEDQKRIAKEQKQIAEEQQRIAEEQKRIAEEQKQIAERERHEKEAAFAEIERLKRALNKRSD